MAAVNSKIYDKIEEIVNSKNLEIYEIEYVKENNIQFLRVYIDTKDDTMVSLDDCVNVSNDINEYFDEVDPIENEFTLEVTSPGIIRKLTTVRHFEKVLGEQIELKFYKKHDNFEQKVVQGVITDVNEDFIVFEDVEIKYDDIAKAVTVFEF